MKYTVQAGDTLSAIARDVLGDIALWPEIASMNSLPNANMIFAGQVLELPEKITEPVGDNKNLMKLIGVGVLIAGGYAAYVYYKRKTRKQ